MPFKTFKITPTLTLPGHWPAKASQFHKNISIFWKNLHLHLTSIFCPWLDFYIWDCKSPFGTDLIVSRENCVRPEDSPSWEHFPSFMVVTKRRDCFQHNTQQHILFRELHNTTPLMSGVRNYHCAPHTDSCSIEFLNFAWTHNFWRRFEMKMLVPKVPHWQAEQNKVSKKTCNSEGFSILSNFLKHSFSKDSWYILEALSTRRKRCS